MIVGIVGAGQLARMLALAGLPLGLSFAVLDPAADACASQVAPLIQGAYDDQQGLAELAARSTVITFDFENVPAAAARWLQDRVPVFPPPAALEAAQDRLGEKTLFRELGIATPAFAAADTLDELRAAIERIGLPAMLKTRRFGYDGKGQRLLREDGDIAGAWAALGGAPLIVEEFVAFQREVSCLAVRARSGERAFYPLVENRHRDGILHLSTAPCDAPELEVQARDYTGRLLDRLDYVGVLAVEFFAVAGQLVANEMAPRVHNSGHWTIEGAETSQFENHLRALLGWPLGSTATRGHSAMLNLVGVVPARQDILAIPGAHLHDYGKMPRAGRKLGHVTLRAEHSAELRAPLERLLALNAACC